MTLLDRFRTPPQRHSDPAARLAHLGEIPLTERELIAAIAREDEDPRVRRAAVAKLMDPAALGAISRDDPDESVRGQAAAMLRDIALDAFEGVGEGESLEAIDALTDTRSLSMIAKTATREIVALRALSRLSDAHALGSIARHALCEAARRAAFERVRSDKNEIFAIAMNSDHKDSALAALDLVDDRGELEQIAVRGKNKSAAKRARAILREADERRDAEAAVSRSASAEAEPVRAPMPGEPVDAADDTPALLAVEEHARAEAERARAEAEADARRQREAEADARREAAAQEEAKRVSERRHGRMAELIEVAAAAAEKDLVDARRQMGVVRLEWKDLAAGIDVDEALTRRLAEIEGGLAARETEAREQEARVRRDALNRMHQLINRVEPLATRPDLTLKAAERALRDIRTVLGAIPRLPSKQDVDEVSRRLKAAQAALTPKAQELREADEWQRWANVGIQEKLCVRMEALAASEDPEAIAREVRELQQQWKESADVPRAQADALWRRFKTAHDNVWARCEAYFAAQAAERADNLARKTALCEQVEALADSTRWIETAEIIKKLQADWKAIGPVSRGREKAIWDRFRAACDRFFTRRHEDLDRLKKVWAENFSKKEALCANAESLADSTDWDQTAAELRRLQAEWKTIGPVKKSRSEAIWQRFRGACDRFFARYAQRHDVARAERISAREAVCADLEALSPEGDAGEPPADLVATVRAVRARWQQEIAARGVDPDHARALDERFAAAFARVTRRWPAAFAGTDLDPEANRKRMESIVHRLEELAGSLPGAAVPADASLTPATRLAAMLKEALAANTIGGKVDEESRWRAAAEEVRQAQASWSRVGHVPEDTRRALTDRFQRACRRITERAAAFSAARPAGSGGTGRPRPH
jgi:hypothetical protein